ncbi:MAG: M24 family metallopeptidase [Alphaproteobacteria bacterium]
MATGSTPAAVSPLVRRARQSPIFALTPAPPCARRFSRPRPGGPINAIAKAVEGEARRGGYNIIDGLAGHGVGRFIHEAPTVANIYSSADRQRLHEGLVIAIEPFPTKGSGAIVEADAGWTLKTADGSLAAQYEHSVVITKGNPIILT